MNDGDKKPLLRDELLAQEKTRSLDESNRKEIEKMIDKETKQMRLIKWTNIPVYLLLVMLGTVLATVGGLHAQGEPLLMMIIAVLIFVIAGGVVSSVSIMQIRFELMKEIKELRLEILELTKKLGDRT